MKPEIKLFLVPAPFFMLMATIYGVWTSRQGHFEPVGTAAIFLTALLMAMIGSYLAMAARRMDPRPEDDPDGEIADREGPMGQFAPWSWWPIVLAGAAALATLALAVGWWVLGLAAVVGTIGLVGWVFEFSRGQYSH